VLLVRLVKVIRGVLVLALTLLAVVVVRVRQVLPAQIINLVLGVSAFHLQLQDLL
jgi:hypothetical protein